LGGADQACVENPQCIVAIACKTMGGNDPCLELGIASSMFIYDLGSLCECTCGNIQGTKIIIISTYQHGKSNCYPHLGIQLLAFSRKTFNRLRQVKKWGFSSSA
jgi:hypothetical protein